MNQQHPEVQAEFVQGRETKDQHPLDHRKGKIIPEKYLLLLHDYTKAFDCGSQQMVEIS